MKKISFLPVFLTLLFVSNLSFAKGLSISDPYVREVPPGQMISAAFMMLKNDTNKEVALIKASSDVAKTVELHEHVHDGGMMKMRQVPKIVIPANGVTPLKPGGYHIMLIGLTRKIKAGDKINLTLDFDNGDQEKITATVKKIMMGMKGMKKGGKKDEVMKKNEDTSHLNPMPNLMQVFKQMPEKLNLSQSQTEALKKGIEERSPKIQALFKSLKKNEKEIFDATLSGESISSIDQIADKIMQDRLGIMKGKALCRETTKDILDENQYKKLVALYRSKIMPNQTKKIHDQSKMARLKHVNPLPNLMFVIKKMADKLNLSEKQVARLKAWQDEREPVIEKQSKAVLDFEKEINQASLNDQPLDKIYQLADAITMERMKIIRGKVFSRDKLEEILNPEQYKKLIQLYKEHSR